VRLLARVERLEASMGDDGEARDIVRILVPAKDGRPLGTDGGFQRIRYGDLVWHREAGEAEADFIERVKVAAPRHPDRRGVRAFVADYGNRDDA
jgi:hypothetical protein